MSTLIKQTVTFSASPNEVYEALMDSKKHTAFTKAKASISKKVKGKFTAYDGYCFGKNLELIPDSLIMQEWRTTEWEETETSVITIQLASVKGGTKLTFTQRGVPQRAVASIKQGWIDYYWKPMKTYFAEL